MIYFTDKEKRAKIDAVAVRVKIDDMNVSSSKCHFESGHHTIPTVHV